MKQLVKFPLENGQGSVVVEVDAPEDAMGMETVARGGEVVRRANHTFEAALDTIRPAAQAIIGKLRTLSEPPHEIRVEFGLKMKAEAGAVIAATGMEAHYKVTLTWKRQGQ